VLELPTASFLADQRPAIILKQSYDLASWQRPVAFLPYNLSGPMRLQLDFDHELRQGEPLDLQPGASWKVLGIDRVRYDATSRTIVDQLCEDRPRCAGQLADVSARVTGALHSLSQALGQPLVAVALVDSGNLDEIRIAATVKLGSKSTSAARGTWAPSRSSACTQWEA
jgi:hypothetical protein